MVISISNVLDIILNTQMKQQGYINDKKVEYFKVYSGFGGKNYFNYEDPNNSSILASSQEYEIFKEEHMKDKSKPQEDLGFKVSMKKNKPTNLTHEQKQIEQKILNNEDKVSLVTVTDSRFMSDIFQHNYQVCEMCSARDNIIDDKDKQIQEKNKVIKEKELEIQQLKKQVRKLESLKKQNEQTKLLKTKNIQNELKLLSKEQTISKLEKQLEHSQIKIKSHQERLSKLPNPERIKQKIERTKSSIMPIQTKDHKEKYLYVFAEKQEPTMLIHLTDSVIELNDSVNSAKRESLNDKVESLVEEIKMSRRSGMNPISQIYIEM